MRSVKCFMISATKVTVEKKKKIYTEKYPCVIDREVDNCNKSRCFNYLFIYYFYLWVEKFFEAEPDAVNCYLLNLD